ncbi:YckD family protein [Bacillus smithii]|uniref:YckD family protein n=1 Tax=Bacillus smithii TaxID=1479 RepID=UPI003D1CCA01
MFTFPRKIMAIIFVSVAMFAASTVHAETNQGKSNEKPVQLTEQQKAKLNKLHKELLEKRKELIRQYVAYGIISKEKGDDIISHLEEHYKHLQQNGFSPHWNHSEKGHWHHKHHHDDSEENDNESKR